MVDIPVWAIKLAKPAIGIFNKLISFIQLNSKYEILKIENNTLKESLERANENISALNKQIIGIHDIPIEFDSKTGTWIDNKTGEHFCPSCKSKNIISPMKKYGSGWECPIKECKTFQKNPEYNDSGAVFTEKNGAW